MPETCLRPVSQRMCDRCNVRCAVIALPKSIDNDFLMVRGRVVGRWMQ